MPHDLIPSIYLHPFYHLHLHHLPAVYGHIAVPATDFAKFDPSKYTVDSTADKDDNACTALCRYNADDRGMYIRTNSIVVIRMRESYGLSLHNIQMNRSTVVSKWKMMSSTRRRDPSLVAMSQ